MDILYISEKLPYVPSHDGFRLVAYNMIKNLSVNNAVHLISLISSKEEMKHLECIKPFCASVDTAIAGKTVYLVEQLKNLLGIYTADYEMCEKITSAIKRYKIEAICIEGAHIGHNARKINGLPKVIFPHDSSSARLYSFAINTQSLNERIRLFYRWLKAIQYEKKVYRMFQHCIVVSQEDKNNINRHLPKLNTTVITNGVDCEYYQFKPYLGEEKNIIFTGNMSYGPNVDAVLYFYNKIFPLIYERVSDVRLYIVGASPADAILKLSGDRRVIVTGTVDDIRTYVNKCAVFVSPLRCGTGIKNKILESLAMGIPIVATSSSISGIDVRNGENIVIQDEPEYFARSVIELLCDRDKRLKLARNGRKVVESCYSWKTRAELLASIFQKLPNHKSN
jgi:sugar transferase (PEP-CTERM/EpsH1 system associated)